MMNTEYVRYSPWSADRLHSIGVSVSSRATNRARSANEVLEARGEIHVQEELVGILIARPIGLNHGCRVRQHLLEPIEEEAVHVREMTRVFVGGPAPRRRSSLENRWRHLAHERQHDVRRAPQRIDDRPGSIHLWFPQMS